VFGTNELLPQSAGILNGKLQYLLGPGGKLDNAGFLQTVATHVIDHLADPFRGQAQVTQRAAGHPAVLDDQANQNVFCINIGLAQPLGLFMRQREHFARPLSKTFHACQRIILLNRLRSFYQ